MAEAISATDRAEANVTTPPAAQAKTAMRGEPALASTTLGLRKMPLPIIMPTTRAKASTKLTDFFNMALFWFSGSTKESS